MKNKIVIFAGCVMLSAFAACGPSYKMIDAGINSPDLETRREAAKQLRGAKKITPKMTPALVKACRDADPDVRMYAYFAMKNADPHEEGVVPALLDGMNDTSVHVRRALAASLNDINPFPNVCLPPMVKLLVDPDGIVSQYTHSAFADMEGLGIGSLMRNIDSPDAELRLAIVNVLGAIGPPAKNTLGKLRAMRDNDADLRVKEAAERAIGFIEE